MATTYEILVYNPQRSVLLARLETFATLEYVLNDNGPGAMTLVIPPIVPRSYFTADTQIEVWRTANNRGAVLEGGAQWFVERITDLYSAERLITLECVDAMALLARRDVMYYASSNQTNMTGPADDVMKAIMRQNYPSDPPLIGRVIGGVGGTELFLGNLFSVAGDVSQLPEISKAFSWANVLDTLQSITQMSFAAGLFGAFRMVQVNPNTGELQFLTYANASGVDRRATVNGQGIPIGVTLTPQNGSIVDGQVIEDWTDTATAVIAGGQGEGQLRALGYAIKPAASAWGYRELFAEQTNTNSLAALNNYAAGKLQAAQPKRTISGTINETSNIRYGIDFGLGYLLTADIGDFTVDCRVNQVHVSIAQDTGEVIEAGIINETTIV